STSRSARRTGGSAGTPRSLAGPAHAGLQRWRYRENWPGAYCVGRKLRAQASLSAELPSGRQFEIRRGRQHAVVVEVGATLREYSIDGVPAIDGFQAHEMADGGRGQPLLPWPNRLADGLYTFDGREL